MRSVRVVGVIDDPNSPSQIGMKGGPLSKVGPPSRSRTRLGTFRIKETGKFRRVRTSESHSKKDRGVY